MATLILTLVASPAHAATAASLSLDSDYRFRGYSLSRSQADLRLSLAYDHASGAYAGLSIIGTRAAGLAGYVGYAGYVWHPEKGPRWEAGVTTTHVRDHEDYDYSEIYAGVITQDVTARLYYAPNYFNSRSRTLYAEVNTGRPVADRWRVFAHAGYLMPLSGRLRGNRYDLKAGIALNLSHYVVQMAFSQSTPQPAYPFHPADDGQAVTVTLSDFF